MICCTGVATLYHDFAVLDVNTLYHNLLLLLYWCGHALPDFYWTGEESYSDHEFCATKDMHCIFEDLKLIAIVSQTERVESGKAAL